MKVGDRVRITENVTEPHKSFRVLPAGTVGVITEVFGRGTDYPYEVCADGIRWWYPADALEPVDGKE